MDPRRLVVMTAAVLLVVSASACAAGWSAAATGERNRLTRDQLVETNSTFVYDALERLRPNWMTGRGPVSATDSREARANVYINGSRMGGLAYLQNVYVTDVEELRYYEAGEASARFGMGNPRGVIEIVPRR